jgi:hypothetical protein
MIYLIPEQENLLVKENHFPFIIKSDDSSSTLDFLSNLIDPKEDEVDLQLDKIDGRISREPNPQLYDKKLMFFKINISLKYLDVNIISMENVYIVYLSNLMMKNI